jgi:phospholipid-binding lipoprotein MlaA
MTSIPAACRIITIELSLAGKAAARAPMVRARYRRNLQAMTAHIVRLAFLGVFSGCAATPAGNPADPLENINRVTFRVNDALDRAIAIPVARGYNAVVPGPVRTAVANFFSNIGDVSVMLNNFAQGRGVDGFSDLMRVLMNSSFGLAGLNDIATPAGLPRHDQDFGLTLGHWGIPTGPYLVLPLFGPSTFRDTVGFVVDLNVSPTQCLATDERNTLFGVNFVSTRARYLGATNLLSAAALDKYLFVRDAYLGRRRYQLNGGTDEALPNYDDPGKSPGTKQ